MSKRPIVKNLIYLFGIASPWQKPNHCAGSHARGEAGKHSDLDLLIVLQADYNWPKRGDPIRRAIADHFILPVDLIVCTPEHVAKQRNNPYSVIHTSLETGELLYERRAA